MRQLLALGLLLLVAACATPMGGGADPTVRLNALPSRIAGFERQRITTYPQPGLGASVNYNAPGTVATVYLYDRGQADVAAAPRENFTQEMNLAWGEIQLTANAGRYRVVQLGPAFTLPGPDRGLTIGCVRIAMVLAEQRAVDSFVCVGFSGRHYLKLRFTGPQGSEPLLRGFVGDLITRL